MAPQKLTLHSIADIHYLTEALMPMIKPGTIVAFSGDLGAGKTTCIKDLCSAIGVDDACSSPSYSIVNEYQTRNKKPVFHFDFYRLKTPSELLDIGWEEYINSEAIILIEWPEMADELVPSDAIRVELTTNVDESRTAKISNLL